MQPMDKKIPITEIFKSIQGEGRFQGQPVTFVRVSGCTRKCDWCDTNYHTEKQMMTQQEVKDRIEELMCPTVVWTGGEPLMYIKEIVEIIDEMILTHDHHIETNGDLLTSKCAPLLSGFTYLCVSPKEKVVAERVFDFLEWFPTTVNSIDIKVVTDLETVGMDMLEYATMLMPLSTYEIETDQLIRQRVWNYCVEHGLKYSGRLHVEIWKQARGK